jgi:transcriptional regulator with XRE-family HTH domain
VDKKAFGAKLKELREAADMTQKQLADGAGVNQRTVSSLEQGRYEPVWSTVQGLCAALGVSCEAFNEPPAEREPSGRGRPATKKAEEQPAVENRKRGRPKKGTS